MNASALQSPFSCNAAALSAVILPKLQVRPASTVLGWTLAETTTWCIARDRGNLAAAEQNYAAACAGLGVANRSKTMRRIRQGQALRTINTRRAQLRRARVALAASLAAALDAVA